MDQTKQKTKQQKICLRGWNNFKTQLKAVDTPGQTMLNLVKILTPPHIIRVAVANEPENTFNFEMLIDGLTPEEINIKLDGIEGVFIDNTPKPENLSHIF